MKVALIFSLITLLFINNFVNAQQVTAPNVNTTPEEFKLIPAVKTTIDIDGESYVVARGDDNKLVFLKTEARNNIVKPILVNISFSKE